MGTALVHHHLEFVDEPFLAAMLIALNWLVPAFELLTTLKDVRWRFARRRTVCRIAVLDRP